MSDRLPVVKRTETLALRIKVSNNTIDPKMGGIEVTIVQVEQDYSIRGVDDSNRNDPDHNHRWSCVLPLNHLCISGYLTIDEPGAWGRRASYREVWSIELDDARAMAATLEKIEKGLAKLEQKAGSPASFGAYVQRVASILGISLVYHGREAASPVVSGIEYQVDREIQKWHESHEAVVKAC